MGSESVNEPTSVTRQIMTYLLCSMHNSNAMQMHNAFVAAINNFSFNRHREKYARALTVRTVFAFACDEAPFIVGRV